MDEATLARVEEQRLQLEDNIASLRKSLRHWQTLEIDYEGLKEEYLGLPEGASSEQCLQAARNFGPDLVDEVELQTILLDKANGHKKPSQLVDLFTKRSDYVLRNIETIRKQISNAEKKRNALLLAENPDFQDDAGLPLKEITEELDDDGEVVSSKVQAAGETASNLVDVLRRAGVTDLKVDKENKEQTELSQNQDVTSHVSIGNKTGSQTLNAIAQGSTTTPTDDEAEESSGSGDVEEVADSLGPMNPEDTAEDAALRQEMLQYGLGEVGAIVAELDLQEGASDVSYDELDDKDELSDYDEDENSNSDQSEDEKGAVNSTVMSDRYVRKMESLQKKFAAEGLQNVGPEANLPDNISEQLNRPPAAEAARKAALARAETEDTKSAMKQKSKDEKPRSARKQVAFAEELDIADRESNQTSSEAEPQPQPPPISSSIVERTPHSTDTNTDTKTSPPSTLPPHPKKQSKFKASRLSTPQTPMFPPKFNFPPTPSPPAPSTLTPSSFSSNPSQILSPSLIERPSPLPTNISAPTDLNETLHQKEIALEYQRLRNRKMHEQGGYIRGGEDDNYGDETAPLPREDEVNGGVRKVSRFKAARLRSGES